MLMLMSKQKKADIQLTTTRVTRTIYFFVAIFALSIIIFDSWNLITSEAVVQRWTIASGLFVVNTVVWFFSARPKQKSTASRQALLITVLSLSLLVFAGTLTYWERGMASTSTILYALPILVIATLHNRHALIAIAALAAGTYSFAAVKYFNDFFNEGFRIQLWGALLLMIGTLFTITWLVMVITGLRKDSR